MFNKGETVVCIINSRASLTVGKEYTIKEVNNYDGDDSGFPYQDLLITNDSGYDDWYDLIRFTEKSNFREYKINEILK